MKILLYSLKLDIKQNPDRCTLVLRRLESDYASAAHLAHCCRKQAHARTSKRPRTEFSHSPQTLMNEEQSAKKKKDCRKSNGRRTSARGG